MHGIKEEERGEEEKEEEVRRGGRGDRGERGRIKDSFQCSQKGRKKRLLTGYTHTRQRPQKRSLCDISGHARVRKLSRGNAA